MFIVVIINPFLHIHFTFNKNFKQKKILIAFLLHLFKWKILFYASVAEVRWYVVMVIQSFDNTKLKYFMVCLLFYNMI